MTEQANMERYRAAMRAMQSGVAFKMNYEGSETTPKSLRAGVNSALIDSGAIAQFLIAKGVFTAEEFSAQLAENAEREVKMYEDWIRARFGPEVTIR